MHNQKLESVDTAKYLGVNISKDLSWNTYINNITASANRTLGFVKRNVQTKKKISEHWLITLLSALRLSMGQLSGAPTRKKIKKKLKWFKEGQPGGCQMTTLPIVALRRSRATSSTENRRYDAHLLMFYKIVYGLVAIPVPSYFERPEVYTDSYFCVLLSILFFPNDCGSMEQVTS